MEDKSRKRIVRFSWIGVLILFLTPIVYFVHLELGLGSLFRTLPSDEKMIANFREHREDFEKLVKIFRYDFSVPIKAGYLLPTHAAEDIMNRAHVVYLCSDPYLWLPPDPYANDAPTEKQSSRKTTHGTSNVPFPKNVYRKFSRPLPKTAYREFSGIYLAYAHGPVRRLADGSPVRKSYYYTPVVPRIRSFVPRGADTAEEYLETPIHSFSLYKSLNTYPPNFLPTECVYRQIEPQWFIEMCHLGE